MAKIYLDSSFGIGLGLLDNSYNMMAYQFINEPKQSSVIHKIIYELLEKHSLKAAHIDNVIATAGPGSYTGMRLASGISEIFSWLNTKTNSFYHFEVPYKLGATKYIWLAKAFKGEVFIYQRDGDIAKNLRVSESDIFRVVEEFSAKGYKTYCFGREALAVSELDSISIVNTKELLEANLSKICQSVVESNEAKEIYYFRSIEEEFKPSVKV